ncbi:MAG: prepilin-type N-terminal cleavage/methylation domain-containing protein [Rhodospirillaceae bacterium]|nr:MAG: prepilin-type N-terminal cleavage/methylation domain-containing protein [Rhodospirillaceae bacterium]
MGVVLTRFDIRGKRLKPLKTFRSGNVERGFTLIEMAIVMVVIGLLLSGGILALAPVIESSKTTETNGHLDRIEQALTVYVIQNGCLPCPANPSIASTVTVAPRAGYALAGGEYTGCTATACTYASGTAGGPGGVPWANLGLSEGDATDGFGNRIAYTITPGLQNTNGMQRTPPSSYPSGTISINNYAGTAQTTAAAYVLVSYGTDGSFGYARSTGTQQTAKYGQVAGNASAQGRNAEGSTTFNLYIQDTPVSAGGTGYFDDIVRWRTAPNIIQSCGSNACGNPP